MKWFLLPFKKYADFSGRSRRKEFWMFQLFNFILYLIILSFVFSSGFMDNGMNMMTMTFMSIYGIYAIIAFIPSLAVSVRRLHDVGKSGWFLLISLIPIIGGIWFLILMCTEGNPEANEYGPNPKIDDLDMLTTPN